MQITKNAVVRIEYTLTDDAGSVLDTSDGSEPLSYVHGTESIIPGLEKELGTRSVGEEFTVRIPPEQAYGLRDEDMVHDVPRDQLPADTEISVGMQFNAESANGFHVLTVVGLGDDTVKMDANHPLAGIALTFQVKIVEVREATQEELAHGHVHGPGGHEH